MLQVGEMLGKSLAEVRAMPASEITSWLAYFKMKNKKPEEEKEVSTADKFKKMMQR